MKLNELRVEGFGKLESRNIAFDPHFNIVYGPNEAGKSTLTTAIIATLYGVGRKEERDAWRPWSGGKYSTALRYTLDDGRVFEVQRDFEKDPKGVRVYDESGDDVSAELSFGKVVNPGLAHLRIPLEVFLNAACLTQGASQIDGARAEKISSSLAQALDGGPREDAALGAIRRLDEALAAHVGTKRATINAPLRHLQDEIAAAETRAVELRAKLRTLDDLRLRKDAEIRRASELEQALHEHDRRARALRAQMLSSRLEALREIHDDVSALYSDRAHYADVDDFPSGSPADLEARHREWQTAEALAASATETAQETRMTLGLEAELTERASDGGSLDEAAFTALQEAAAEATDARIKATFAAAHVQGSRRTIEGGNELFGAAFATGAIVTLATLVLAIFHNWLAAPIGALALLLFIFAWKKWNRRRDALRMIAKMERRADSAMAVEKLAAGRVAAVLEPLAVASIEELARRRDRWLVLQERKTSARRNAERARNALLGANSAGQAFDALARTLVPPSGSREGDVQAARVRDARRSARDGIDMRLSMLEVRRQDVLGNDDEAALKTELAELLAAGIQPSGVGGSQRAFEGERLDLERRHADSRSAAAATEAELRTSESQLEDLAGLDERVQTLREAARKLERFETALSVARHRIEDRTREAHQKFARRLTDYASRTFDGITAGRYVDVRVDPTTLAVRVRVPETGAIVDVERLSAGTREQAYLVVRLAMVRMFAEGIETAPIVLDDPFALWDEARIERGLPILKAAAHDGQLIVFTTSRELADAASKAGAHRIDLDAAMIREQRRPSLR